MTVARSLLAGAAGAVALTAVHQTAIALTDRAPRMDVLGMRAIAGLSQAAGVRPPRPLYAVTLAGDLLSNALYYSLVAAGTPGREWTRGALLGLGAGVGAVVLPPVLGLGRVPSGRTPATAAMAVAWYTIGGLAAAATARRLRP
ncbi:MAG TPA: hypothetical protein VF576_04040 [Rubricoccaceae bacterium]